MNRISIVTIVMMLSAVAVGDVLVTSQGKSYEGELIRETDEEVVFEVHMKNGLRFEKIFPVDGVIAIKKGKMLPKKPEQIKTNPPEIKTGSQKPESCPVCRGTGVVKCLECNGSGYVKCDHIGNDGKKHVNWYEICRKCNGKGKIPEYYEKTTRYYRKDRWHYKTKLIKKYVPCPDCFEVLDEDFRRIYVTWVCPHCGNSRYKGYIKCKECKNGRVKCKSCNGTGLKNKTSPPTQPAALTIKSKPGKLEPATSIVGLIQLLERNNAHPTHPQYKNGWNELTTIQKDEAIRQYEKVLAEYEKKKPNVKGMKVEWRLLVEDISQTRGREDYTLRACSKDGYEVTAIFANDQKKDLLGFQKNDVVRVSGTLQNYKLTRPAEFGRQFDTRLRNSFKALLKDCQIKQANE